jgi:hypothetical protein
MSGTDTDQLSGLEFATVIFLFIAGLNSFKEEFGLLIQNGISRKTVFAGRILTSLTVAMGMAVIDKLVSFIFQGLNTVTDGNIGSSTLFELVYKNYRQEGMLMPLTSFLFSFFLYLCFSGAGYFITTAFYRLGKAGKVALSVSLPVGIFVVLPIFDYTIAGGRITAALYKFLDFALGISSGRLINEMITCTLAFLIFSGFSWLLIRKASVKE